MNPHRLAWGFAYDMPFAMIIGVVTILAWVLSREPKRIPLNALVIVLLVFTAWISITTVLAQVPAEAFDKWDKTMKILLMAFLTILLMSSRERVHALVWVMVVSIGYYGVKGGLFTVMGGAAERVWGPNGSFLGDNNALALALLMILPLMRYLQLQSNVAWIRWGIGAAMLLASISVVGSYSRGALLAGTAMTLVLALKSRKRVMLVGMMVIAIGLGAALAPQKWYDRMATIETYEQDQSAMGRIRAWTFAYRYALDHPVFGGGFGVNTDEDLVRRYVPEADKARNFHSVYFEVLGCQGFVGLFIFLLLGFVTMRWAGRTVRLCRGHSELTWASDLASMTQVSLVGYAVGGAFQNLAFFDLFYHIIAIVVLARILVERVLRSKAASVREAPSYPAGRSLPVGQ